MPLRDGKGPFGIGPRSGRGRGPCGSQYGSVYRDIFRGRNGSIVGIAVPLLVAAVRDLLNPSGLLRQIIHSSTTRHKENNIHPVGRDTEYAVLKEKQKKLDLRV